MASPKNKKSKKKPLPSPPAAGVSWIFPLLMITANAAAFAALHNPAVQKALPQLILYPGNLLQGRIWCLVTSGFIHHNLEHLLLNMLGVFVFGRIVERHLGLAKTCFIYFGSLAVSMIFAVGIYALILKKSVAIIGASGAVMGLIAAAMLLDPFTVTYEMILPIPVMVKGWLFLYADFRGFLGGEQDGVSHLAHLCGFLSIGVLTYFLSHEDKRKLMLGLLINIFSFVGFLFLRNWLVVNKWLVG